MKNLLNYFWLLMILVNGINAAVFWLRAQPYIQQNPNLRPGYIRLISWFFVGFKKPGFSLIITRRYCGFTGVGILLNCLDQTRWTRRQGGKTVQTLVRLKAENLYFPKNLMAEKCIFL
jgi:hypothetical protein